MKNNWKMKKYFLFFGMILVLSLATFYNFHINENTSTEDVYKKNKINLETAGYWDLTGTPIEIDDSDITKNWSITASTEDWCSGSGTWNDPYLIENVTIDGQDADVNCIYITNSKSSYFVIRNCTLLNSGTSGDPGGIKLEGVDNGILINNTCMFNDVGIYIYSNSDNNSILDNVVRDNVVFGISLVVGCESNEISNNTMISNGQYGVDLNAGSNGNNVTNNIIKYNGGGFNDIHNSGVMIQASNDNIVSNNNITNNKHNGVYIYAAWCYDNVIINNNISENNIGIRRSSNVDSTLITDNLIKDNNNYGIYQELSQSPECYIYLNRFIDNGIQAYDNSFVLKNSWDNGTIGNFWSDYSGVDADDNGIGDTPYLIGGDGSGNQDNYPIWYDSPNIKIYSPQPSEIFETTSPTFNVSITDPNLESMWYTLNNGIQKVLFTTNESINQELWDALSDGPNVINFYANDTSGNLNSSSVTVIRDTGAPNIKINDPSLNDVFATAPAFNVEISDFLLNTTWYTVDGGLNKFIFTSNESVNTNAWNNALEGLVDITFYANDTLGKLNSASVSVYKDTLLPNILITYPETDAKFNATAPNFIVEFDEANLVEMWYTINESLTEYAFTVNGTINQAAWNALPEGELNLKFYIEDIAGNIAYDEVYINKTITPTDENGEPTVPVIYSYPLILLITTIWFMSTIILVFIKKNIKKK